MADNITATYVYMLLESAQSGIVKGESLDAAHPNEIQLESFDFGVANPNKSAGDGDWKPDFPPLKVTVIPSRASPFLFKAACDGALFKRLTISCRKTGAKKTGEANGDYMQWRFHNVRVVDYQLKVDDDTPDETIEFSYQVVEMVYIQQSATGTLDDMFQRGWMVGKNKEFAELTLPYKGLGAKG
jgi:type VI secretion system secreted protein Hcp